MYVPRHFEMPADEAAEFAAAVGVGHLVTSTDAGLDSSFVPFLVDRHERRRPNPWAVDDAPADFIDGQLKAIVGVELVVDRVEGKAKLSQNRAEPDRAAVRAAFLDGGEGQRRVGEMMP